MTTTACCAPNSTGVAVALLPNVGHTGPHGFLSRKHRNEQRRYPSAAARLYSRFSELAGRPNRIVGCGRSSSEQATPGGALTPPDDYDSGRGIKQIQFGMTSPHTRMRAPYANSASKAPGSLTGYPIRKFNRLTTSISWREIARCR